jgi:hypothetical protein
MPGIIMAFKSYKLSRPPDEAWIQNRFIYKDTGWGAEGNPGLGEGLGELVVSHKNGCSLTGKRPFLCGRRICCLGQALRHLGDASAAHYRLTEALTVARQVKDEATDGKVLAELELLAEMPEQREVAFA